MPRSYSHPPKTVFLLAGGTGGHLFPAYGLAQELHGPDVRVVLLTDSRGGEHANTLNFDAVYTIPAATPSVTSWTKRLKACFTLARGLISALKVTWREKPVAMVGFGGYPIIPSGLAAFLTHTPLILHEQNGVMGRANRFLASRARAIATGFPKALGYTPKPEQTCVHTGNPVRPEVQTFIGTPFITPKEGESFRLLVFGGSQGAHVMGSVIPASIALLPQDLQKRLTIVQQARPDTCDAVRKAYNTLGVAAEIASFFPDMPARIASAHLVIARAGASTVTELSLLKRPCILVPLPQSLDQDQKENARLLAEHMGGVTILEQKEFTPKRLSALLTPFLTTPSALFDTLHRPPPQEELSYKNAAERLATLVRDIIKYKPSKELRS
jgi:UDP-N-acetylglucosamine--N-acetylmuramyl-(pentapeptide) pyrophosphoryl-undecaprenol N-acetylglucosamine transferase